MFSLWAARIGPRRHPHANVVWGDDGRDLDRASAGVVKVIDPSEGAVSVGARRYPEMPWEPKAGFDALAWHRPGAVSFSVSPKTIQPGFYRVDVMWNGQPAWRAYVRITD